jgi:hypothetical protein
MFIMGYGINMDVENLTFAVLDRDQTTVSREYVLNTQGSRYFTERPPIIDYGRHAATRRNDSGLRAGIARRLAGRRGPAQPRQERP